MFSWIFSACFLLHICNGCAPYFSTDVSEVEEGTEEIPEPARPAAEAALRRAPVTKPPQWYADPGNTFYFDTNFVS